MVATADLSLVVFIQHAERRKIGEQGVAWGRKGSPCAATLPMPRGVWSCMKTTVDESVVLHEVDRVELRLRMIEISWLALARTAWVP